ncbi:hypothetical protein LJ739_11600, partial [Aestuariibacter halophilus]
LHPASRKPYSYRLKLSPGCAASRFAPKRARILQALRFRSTVFSKKVVKWLFLSLIVQYST